MMRRASSADPAVTASWPARSTARFCRVAVPRASSTMRIRRSSRGDILPPFGQTGQVADLEEFAETFDGGDKCVVRDRLAHVCVAPELEATIDFHGIVRRGEHVDGNGARRGVRLEAAEHFD